MRYLVIGLYVGCRDLRRLRLVVHARLRCALLPAMHSLSLVQKAYEAWPSEVIRFMCDDPISCTRRLQCMV